MWEKIHKPLSIRVYFISGNHATICSVKVNYVGHEIGTRIPFSFACEDVH